MEFVDDAARSGRGRQEFSQYEVLCEAKYRRQIRVSTGRFSTVRPR